jgi:aspartate/methionine/tyrosine aminotransferase
LRAQIKVWLQETGMAAGGEVLVAAGLQEARFLSVQVIGAAAGRIAFPAVVHPGVQAVLAVRRLDQEIMPVDTDQRLLAAPAAVASALKAGARAVYMESPSRWSGACYTQAELTEIIGLCQQNEAALIVDAGLTPWADGSCGSADHSLTIDETVTVIGEAWPGSGIDELQIGYITAAGERIKAITTQKQVVSICTSAPSQNGALAAAETYTQQHPETRVDLKKQRAELESILRARGAKTSAGSVLIFVLCQAEETIQKLLSAAEVPHLDGTDFGRPGFLQVPVSANIIARLQAAG